MAISANAVWEVRSTSTASNANSGFFVTGASGVDYSQQDAAQYNLTGVTTAGADAILLHASAAADMVGNGAHIISGTNFTAGWYEIISVVVGVSITLDRTCTSAAGALGVVNIGGAISLGGATDDAMFESQEPGNVTWIKSGTYTLGATINIAKAGTTALPISYKGYQTTRGDSPLTTGRPLIDVATGASITFGTYKDIMNIRVTGEPDAMVTLGTASKLIRCKVTNTAIGAANRSAVYSQGAATLIHGCEISSNRGDGIYSGTTTTVTNCYIHTCNRGVNVAGNSMTLIQTIIESCRTEAFGVTSADTSPIAIVNCTLYGSENTTGVGINLVSGVTAIRVINTIIYGFVTGIAHADDQYAGLDNYNNYYNNDTDVTNWQMASNAVTTDPVFEDVGQVTGTAGTTASGVLTDGAADFSSVTANEDSCLIVSGTGLTVTNHQITAKTATTLTLSPAPANNAVADTVYQVTTGRNFEITGGAIGAGSPSASPYVESFNDIGAAQSEFGLGVDPSTISSGSIAMGAPGFSL